MFLFKKIVAPLFLPLPICLLLFTAGLVLLWFTRRQKAGRVFVTAGTLILTFCSYDVVTKQFLRPLERQYPPLVLNEQTTSSVKWIVVLGGGVALDAHVPHMSRLSGASLARLVEGIRLHRELSEAKLLLSGSASEAEVMQRLAESLGVGKDRLVLDAESRDTEDQARMVRQIVKDDALILVTSASHMPRSMELFGKAGMRPLPAPTDYEALDSPRVGPSDFYPGSEAIHKAEAAIHEYLGRVWARLRGKA